ncbi:MAG: hypothetical protein Q7T46_01635 [Polaromonas sp.]|nr:hypothetical protein [Polaromonas sp.]
MTPNVKATGAAWLYRAASVLIAGLHDLTLFVGLSVLEQLIKRDPDVFGDVTEQDWGDVSTLMKWNRCAAACGITELFV